MLSLFFCSVLLASPSLSSSSGVQILVDRQEIQSIAINRVTEHFQVPLYVRLPTNRVSGTGWLIDPTTIVTNHHVIAGSVRLGVRTENEGIVPAQIESRCPDLDLAVLRLQSPVEQQPLTTSKEAELGALVAFGGFSASGEWQEKSGRLISAQEIQVLADERQTFLVIDRPSDLGFSGGPVWNSQGQVIGMMTATDGEQSFVLPTTTILDYVRDREYRWGRLGIQMENGQVVAVNPMGPSQNIKLGQITDFQQRNQFKEGFVGASLRRLRPGDVVQLTIAAESFSVRAQPVELWPSEKGDCLWRGASLQSTTEGWRVSTLERSSPLFQMGMLPNDLLLLSESCTELAANNGLRIVEIQRNGQRFQGVVPFAYQE